MKFSFDSEVFIYDEQSMRKIDIYYSMQGRGVCSRIYIQVAGWYFS